MQPTATIWLYGAGGTRSLSSRRGSSGSGIVSMSSTRWVGINLALFTSILYRGGTTEEEMSTEDRRAPGATRMPFDGLVEVGAALGPSFEAQAVNVSEEGIQLRTAYLPELGQPLTCRFDAAEGSVLAAGEVAWAHGSD